LAESDIIVEDGASEGARPVVRLTVVLAVAAVLTVCAAAVPILVGGARLTASIGEWITGYQVEIKGGAELRFWGVPGVDADDVIIRIPENRFVPVESPPLLRVARLEIDLDLWSLMRGVFRARRLVLIRPSLRFDRGADGSNNWSLHGKPRLDGRAPVPGTPVLSVPSFPRAEVASFKINGGTFRYTDARIDRDLTLDSVTIDTGAQRAAEGKILRVRGDALLRGEPVYLEAELKRLEDFHDGIRVPFQIMMDAAPGSLLVRGTVAHRNRWALSAGIDFDVDDPEAVVSVWPLAPAELIGRASTRLQVEIKGGSADIAVRNLVLGSTDLSGRIRTDLDDKLPQIELDIEAGSLDLRHALAAARLTGLFPPSGDKRRRFAIGGRGRIKWSRLKGQDQDFGAGGLGLSWRSGEPNIAVDIGALPIFGGKVSARGEATASEGKTAISLSLSASDIDAAMMSAKLLGGHGISGRMHGNVEVLAVGATAPELLAAVSGGGRLALSEGRIFGSPLQRAIDVNRRAIGLSRASMDFAVEGGVLSSDELLLDFEVGHTRAAVNWDMPSGNLSVRFQPSPLHEGTPPVVSGPLWEVFLAR
jgi:hypothetical protein